MSNLMLLKLGLVILCGGVAAAAVVFYFWGEEIDKILEDDTERDLLERCLERKYDTSSK